MTTEHRVIQHLRELNPIVDETTLVLPDTSPTAFLEALHRGAAPDTRRKPMSVETTTRDTTRTPTPGRRRNLILALGTAAVIAIAIVVGVAIAGSDSGEEVAAAPPLEVAEQILDAHAAGGPVAMLPFFEPGVADLRRDGQQTFQVLNEHIDRASAECQQTAPTRVLCRVPSTNDFHSAGGIDPDITWTFTFNERSQVVALQELAAQGRQLGDFNDAFTEWLLATHPDVAEPGFAPTADPDSARIAIQYVDEFVAQSEVYPRSP